MKPPYAYFGGKVTLSERIVSLMPTHRVYVEPFFGSGAVLFAKPRSTHEVANDLSENVTTFLRVLRDDLAELERVCSLTPHSRSEFLAADLSVGGLSDLERARRFWVRINQSFGKVVNDATGWSLTVGTNTAVSRTIRNRVGRFAQAAERLTEVAIECCDAVELIERLGRGPDVLLYVDPPYLAETRVLRTGGVADYELDMGDEVSHIDLARVLRATKANVILSGYPSPLYDDLYAGWHVIDVEVICRSSNPETGARGTRVERLWMNFEPVEQSAGRLFALEGIA
jgi:DNA adenine methylase